MVSMDVLTMGERKIYDRARDAIWENPLGLVALFCCACGGWELVKMPKDILPYLENHRNCGGDIEVVSE